jgi:hypothetical protein
MTEHFDTIDLLSAICMAAVSVLVVWGYHAFGIGY